jgi:hypothetical protein
MLASRPFWGEPREMPRAAFEAKTLAGEGVEEGRDVATVSVRPEVTRAQGIDHDEDHVGPRSCVTVTATARRGERHR